jgi:integral membrane sensor domain MASE1
VKLALEGAVAGALLGAIVGCFVALVLVETFGVRKESLGIEE